jgi:hypothetical protein
MSTILTTAIVEEAKSAVETYVAEANALYEELANAIRTLTSSDFMGDAADGYTEFFNAKVTPALQENLTDPSASLTASIKAMLESIKTQLLDTVDPQLGDANRDPS